MFVQQISNNHNIPFNLQIPNANEREDAHKKAKKKCNIVQLLYLFICLR